MATDILALVMAGGEGSRLHPLTADRSKPAVPFGGRYRLVDFVLSNLTNSGVSAIYLLVQYQSLSLIEHVRRAWLTTPNILQRHFISLVPPQKCKGMDWFQGTANAVYQNLNLVREHDPEVVAVFGSDHIYRMDVRQMLAFHRDSGADVTVSATPVPLTQGSALGIIVADADGRVRGFQEKPAQPAVMPGRPGYCYASMGNYLFRPEVLYSALQAAEARGDYDFGKDVLPALVGDHRVFSYDFSTNRIPGSRADESSYWRDVGDIDSYFAANHDLLGETPRFDEFRVDWPVCADYYTGPVAKVLGGQIEDSLLGGGVLIRGASLRRSIIRRQVLIDEGAEVEDCIIIGFTRIGRGARLRRVIVDRCNVIEPGTVIGHDPEADAERYHVSPGGVVVTPRGLCAHRPIEDLYI
jgi:glucose-1-phosphate adenylyltransferase